MKKLYYACLLMLIGLLAVATPVLAAVYYANLQVQESDGNSYNRLPIMVSLDNEYLADNNYILDTGLDTRVITGSSVELPHLVVDDRLLFVSNINANNTYNFKYTTGNTPLTDMPIIVGYDGYITISDDADLELGDDFEIEFDGYVDTSSGGVLVLKSGAVVVANTDDEEFAVILSNATFTTPTGHNDPDNDWGSEANAYDDNTGTAALTSPNIAATSWSGYLEFTMNSGIIYGVRVYSSASDPLVNLIDIDYYDTDWHDLYQGNYVASAWEHYGTYATNVTKVRVRYYNSEGGSSWAKIWEFDFDTGLAATVSGISSGEHTIKAYADGTDLGIIFDEGEAGEVSDTTLLSGASVPDNANDIIINQNNVMPYFDYLKWTVSDTLIAWYQPISMIVGTTLDDREGTDAGETGTAEEDGTITWGANPDGVDVDIGSLTAYSQPAPSGTITEPGQDIVDETGQPGWVEPTGTLTTNPFYPLVKMASDQTGFDVTQIWLMIATFFVIGGMLAVFGFVPHQLITVCVGGGITGLFVSMGIYPFWTIFIFLVMGIAVVLWERAPTV